MLCGGGTQGCLWVVSAMKEVSVTKERWMVGDTWSKSTSATHIHTQLPPSNCRTLYTNTHSCQGQTKIIHKTPTALPWVSLTPFLPHIHTHTHSCREAACCPCGLWRIITQQCRLKSREWTSSLKAPSSSSPWHTPPPTKQSEQQLDVVLYGFLEMCAESTE